MRTVRINFTYGTTWIMDALLSLPLIAVNSLLTPDGEGARVLGIFVVGGIVATINYLARTRGAELQKGIQDHES